MPSAFKPENTDTYINGSALAWAFSDGQSLFEDLNFSIGRGLTGIVGPNGSGKSTLLKLVSGALQPLRGSLAVRGRVAVLEQDAFVRGGSTAAEVLGIAGKLAALGRIAGGEVLPELFETVDGAWDIEDAAAQALERMGVPGIALSREFGTLSGGEAVKVRLAGLLLSKPEILLLDEPTNDLDAAGREILAAFLRSWKKCAVVVSHDRELLSLAGRILELSNRGLAAYGGNYGFYVSARQGEDGALDRRIASAREKVKREKMEMRENLERQAHRMAKGRKEAAKGGIPKILAGGRKRRAEKTQGKAKTVHEGILAAAAGELNAVRALARERNEIKVDMPLTEVPNGKLLVDARELNFTYPGRAVPVFGAALSFNLAGPERVALTGPNGSGKSTLLKLILAAGGAAGPRGVLAGALSVKTARIAYLDQKLGLLKQDLTLLENLTLFAPGMSDPDRRLRLARFLFREREALRKTATFSGGEKLRAALACVLSAAEPPQLLMLDEPTNNLDIDSIERLESALANYKGALLVVSHDERFIGNIAVNRRICVGPAGKKPAPF